MATALLILPNFALIVAGVALVRRLGYGREMWVGLEKLVYYILFPALLFRSLATARIDVSAAMTLVASGWTYTIASFLLSIAAGPVLRLDRRFLAAGSQCGYRFNTYVGLAIAGSVFANDGVALTALMMGAMIPLANLMAVAMLARHGDRGFVGELVRHPLVIACLAGFAWNAARLPMPAFAGQTLGLLGQASLPLGLLCVGAAMRFESGGGETAAHAWWLVVKLVATPAIAWSVGRAAGLEGDAARVLMLCSSLPAAPNAYILAVRMLGDGRAVATEVTLGTLLSMATVPLWMAL